MSIIQAMFAGSSALTNFGEAMTVIGNNLANANTTAFKSSSSSFEDVLIQTVGNQGNGASTQIGTGVGLADVRQDMTQGSFSATSNVTDLSIDGKGFFMVKDTSLAAEDAVDEAGRPKDTFYTRAGGFTKDLNGDLVTSGGMVLQGWELDEDGNQRAGGLTDLNLAKFVNVSPTATSLVKVGANLDASTQAKDITVKYNPEDPSTYDFSTSVRVFDTKGTGHNVEIHFRKLPLAIPATMTGGDSTRKMRFDINDPTGKAFVEGQELKIPVTFTSLKDNTEILGEYAYKVTKDDVGKKTISRSVALSEIKAKTDGKAPALAEGVRYKLKVDPPSSSTVTIANVSGDDGVTEIKGVDNDNTWEWHSVVQNDELELGQRSASTTTLTALDLDKNNVKTAPDGATYTSGRLMFDNQGRLVQEGSTPLKFQFLGAETQEILFDFGDALGKQGDATNDFSKKTLELTYSDTTLASDLGNTGSDGCLQVTSGFATLRLEQNGFPSGYLDKLAVNQKGEVIGNFTNGQSKKLYQVALVDFDDETALEQVGSNLFAETVASGLPKIGEPTSGRLGEILSYSLEQSNVDMSAEFVRMITTQRGFQANSRIVTVTDGMLEELLALKR
ncbi:MAG: flagellar hook-basal body complex protein [Magnetococcales bacterium]|nr:flagellar hook-basal body complex protein [Magnetococcales bacterium]